MRKTATSNDRNTPNSLVKLAESFDRDGAMPKVSATFATPDLDSRETMTEQAKRVAVAEAAAKELAEANEVLRRTQANFASMNGLNDFLDGLLLEIGAATDARTLSVFRYDEVDETLKMSRTTCDQQIVDIRKDERFQVWQSPVPAQLNNTFNYMIEFGGVTFDVNPNNPNMWPESVPWHQSMGHKSVVCIPLISNDRPLGFIGACFTHSVDLAESKLNLMRMLAQQASLAIELTRLSEEATRTAVAEQREIAAREKANELQRINDTLQESIHGVSQLDDVSKFPDIVLLQIAKTLDAACVVAFSFDESRNQMAMRHAVQFGEVVDIASDWRFGLWRDPVDMDQPSMCALMQSILDDDGAFSDPTTEPRYLPESHQWHRDLGHQSALFLKMVLDDRLVGFMGVAFSDRDPNVAADKLRLARTLTDQTMLAMELSRLSMVAQKNAITEERNRMAREIHDTVAAGLTGVLLNMEALEETGDAAAEEIAVFTTRAKLLARGALLESRRSVLALRPTDDDVPLVEELRRIPLHIGRDEIKCRVIANDEGRGIPPLVQHELLRVAQEAMTNAMRHADSDDMEIRFESDAESWTLSVTDNGRGFDTETTELGKGFGLAGMRERIEKTRGTLSIESQLGKGTTVKATIKK